MDDIFANESTPLVDSYGIPPPPRDDRKYYQKQLALYLILGSTLLERLAFYTLVSNLVIILKSPDFGWNDRSSVSALYILSGTSYIFTLIFAAISDAKIGRVKTIIFGFIVYLISYILVTAISTGTSRLCPFDKSSCPHGTSISSQFCFPAILVTLICAAIGSGAVQSNMAVLGAEQIQEPRLTWRFFDLYMIAVNIGSIIATSAIPYMQTAFYPKYYIVYIFTTTMLGISALLFIIGCRYYIQIKPYDTVVSKCIPVVISAFQSWRKHKQEKRLLERNNKNPSRENSVNSIHDSDGIEGSSTVYERPSAFLDFAKANNGGKFVDRMVNDVKSLGSALLVFLILIPYWLIYEQIDATFPLQGNQMKGADISHMVTWMSLGDPVIIIIGILILNIFIYKRRENQNWASTIYRNIFIGMFCAMITMIIAGTVEISRQNHCNDNASPPSNSSSLLIYAQLPQNIGMGFAELFATLASYEFAYFAAPRSAQSLFMSMHFCSIGISSYVGAAYMEFFPTVSFTIDFLCLSEQRWQWSFYTYFFILAGVQLLFIIILNLCQGKFKMIKPNLEKTVQYDLR